MAIPLSKAFKHCPRCGERVSKPGINPLKCEACEYIHFFSPTAAVAGILTDHKGRVLFLKRMRDPGKGKLGLPGGFVDAGESIEHALHREVLEEVNLTVERIEYLASFPNSYEYRGVALPVCDMFFVCDVESFETLETQESEVAGYQFLKPTKRTLGRMAFVSNRQAVEAYLAARAES